MPNLLDLCRDLPTREFKVGDTVIQEDEKDGEILVLKSGKVEVLRHETPVTTIVNPGTTFGEIAVLLGRGHTATLVADTPVTCYVIEDAVEFMKKNPQTVTEVARILSRRLMRVSDELVELKELIEADAAVDDEGYGLRISSLLPMIDED